MALPVGCRLRETMTVVFSRLQRQAEATRSRLVSDSLALTFESPVPASDVQRAIRELNAREAAEFLPSIGSAAVEGLKFAECLQLPAGGLTANSGIDSTGVRAPPTSLYGGDGQLQIGRLATTLETRSFS